MSAAEAEYLPVEPWRILWTSAVRRHETTVADVDPLMSQTVVKQSNDAVAMSLVTWHLNDALQS